MEIEVGLCGWGDHDRLYVAGTKGTDKLRRYADHFSIVEVDSTFYAIQSRERFAKWVAHTPGSLRFIVKAYRGMTGHQRGAEATEEEQAEMAVAFRRMLEPALAENRLVAILFQYPPWFDCNSRNVKLLRQMKRRMTGLPCALEFRHQSWFAGEMGEKTIQFMEQEGWIHSICDEPQAGEGSVPTVLRATFSEAAIVRMHGRNVSGWNSEGRPDWREVRYLYRYSQDELKQWVACIESLSRQCRHLYMLFNNNSGGDAADNAKEMMQLLGLARPDGREPMAQAESLSRPEVEQLELF